MKTTALRSQQLGRRLTSLLLVLLSLACFSRAFGMEVTVVGDQMVLTGPVIRGDYAKIQRILTGSPDITTVILRDSPGGDAATGYQVGEFFRARGLRTAVSGFCYSSCSRMFLGGKERVFTDDMPPQRTEVGLHGHYDQAGRLDQQAVERFGLKDWIIRYSDQLADPALVGRWIAIPVGRGMIHFFYPVFAQHNGVSTFLCQGPAPPGKTVFDCEPITETALDVGIITSLDVIHTNGHAGWKPLTHVVRSMQIPE